jgi:hypothetical protein
MVWCLAAIACVILARMKESSMNDIGLSERERDALIKRRSQIATESQFPWLNESQLRALEQELASIAIKLAADDLRRKAP